MANEVKSSIKPELEKLSKDIKLLKSHIKYLQREYERLKLCYNVDPNISFDDLCYRGDIVSPVKDKLLSALNDISVAHDRKIRAVMAYRVRHIIYSLYNGTPMEKIEGFPYTKKQISHLYYGKREISYEMYLKLMDRLICFNVRFYRYNSYYGRIIGHFFESDIFEEATKYQQRYEKCVKLRHMKL